MRLIDEDTLLKVLEEHRDASVGYEHWSFEKVITIVKVMPTVSIEDAVEEMIRAMRRLP